MKIVFFGSSKYSTIVEKAIYEHFGLSLIVTIPDKITGRKKELTPSPVKQFALENNIPVLTADKLTPDYVEQIKAYQPDFLVVADFRLILPEKLLDFPKFAPLNVHHSLLPKYRGPSPAPSAILNGEKETGVSIILMKEKIDSGDILCQKKYLLKSTETTDSLLTELNKLGAEIIADVLQNYKSCYQKRVKQNEQQATFTGYMKKTDGYIDIANPPPLERIDRMVRAYYPWPGVYTQLRIKNKELRIKFLPEKKIQPEGKKPMSIKDFLNGYPEGRELLEKLRLIDI